MSADRMRALEERIRVLERGITRVPLGPSGGSSGASAYMLPFISRGFDVVFLTSTFGNDSYYINGVLKTDGVDVDDISSSGRLYCEVPYSIPSGASNIVVAIIGAGGQGGASGNSYQSGGGGGGGACAVCGFTVADITSISFEIGYGGGVYGGNAAGTSTRVIIDSSNYINAGGGTTGTSAASAPSIGGQGGRSSTSGFSYYTVPIIDHPGENGQNGLVSSSTGAYLGGYGGNPGASYLSGVFAIGKGGNGIPAGSSASPAATASGAAIVFYD